MRRLYNFYISQFGLGALSKRKQGLIQFVFSNIFHKSDVKMICDFIISTCSHKQRLINHTLFLL